MKKKKKILININIWMHQECYQDNHKERNNQII